MKEKILKSLLMILSIIILIYISFVLYSKLNTSNIIGVWESTDKQIIKNGQEKELKNNEGYIINFMKNNELKLCYYVDGKMKCGITKYKYKNGILNIEDNEWYLKGQYEVVFEKDTLILNHIYSNKDVTKLYYKKQ